MSTSRERTPKSNTPLMRREAMADMCHHRGFLKRMHADILGAGCLKVLRSRGKKGKNPLRPRKKPGCAKAVVVWRSRGVQASMWGQQDLLATAVRGRSSTTEIGTKIHRRSKGLPNWQPQGPPDRPAVGGTVEGVHPVTGQGNNACDARPIWNPGYRNPGEKTTMPSFQDGFQGRRPRRSKVNHQRR